MSIVEATIWSRVLAAVYLALAGVASLLAQDYPRDSRPELFSYDELVRLESERELSPELAAKLHVLTTTAFISNDAYIQGARPRPLNEERIGPTLRVAFWNIERGLELDDIKLFLTDNERFMAKVAEERKHAKESGKRIREVDPGRLQQEIEALKAADVWILNEVDWGVKRTQYRGVIRELGETLNMNWAFGVEFLEVDTKQLGTDSFDYGEDEQAHQQLLDVFKVDKQRLRALHGMLCYHAIRYVWPALFHFRSATIGTKRAKSVLLKKESEKRQC